MYERSYGYRYDEVKDLTTVAIAKRIRADVKQAVAEGLLPSRWSYRVRTDHGTSIDVDVCDCPDAWVDCDGTRRLESGSLVGCPDVWCAGRNDPAYAHAAHVHQVLTEEASIAKMTLQRIHGGYNYDGSEVQVDYFDVRYYGGVTFENASSAEFRKREAERLAARKAAREAGEIVGKVANYKRDGSHVTHLVVEIPTPDGHIPTRKALACGSRSWRGPMICKAADDAEVTCSRCAKRAAASREP